MAKISGRHAAFPMFTNETILRHETYTLFVTHTAPSWRGSVFHSLLPRDRGHAVYDGIERGNIANPNDPTNSRAESDAWAKANRDAMAAHYQMSHIDKPRNGYHAKRRPGSAFVFVPLGIWFAVESEHIFKCKRFGCGICSYLNSFDEN